MQSLALQIAGVIPCSSGKVGNHGTNLNNTGPLVRQRVVSTGSASYTYVKSHTFSANDRRYDASGATARRSYWTPSRHGSVFPGKTF
jgi:hypothetical protein